jgi:hypothetical protein
MANQSKIGPIQKKSCKSFNLCAYTTLTKHPAHLIRNKLIILMAWESLIFFTYHFGQIRQVHYSDRRKFVARLHSLVTAR